MYLYFAFGLASIIGRVLVTKLNAIQCIKPLYLFQLSLLGVGIAMVTVPVADTWVKLLICFIAIGFFDSGVFTPLSSVVAECVEGNKVKQGWVFLHFIMGLSSAFGPPVAGKSIETELVVVVDDDSSNDNVDIDDEDNDDDDDDDDDDDNDNYGDLIALLMYML